MCCVGAADYVAPTNYVVEFRCCYDEWLMISRELTMCFLCCALLIQRNYTRRKLVHLYVFIRHKQARKMNYEAAVREEMAVLVCDRCYADVVELYAVTVCVQDRRCTCKTEEYPHHHRDTDDSTCDNCGQVACPRHEMSWVRLKQKK